ncbi:hypothetical protein SYNTR_2029 [Candidatus Syntrophocurvum alkaliphilum]|uniref:Pyridinium-3,5-bisthiocarboxylic acid mononucleotide nickel insertion protein n=1 Tax=Candidatus Syntrophocurvum alkaliphilum TaxID=2293317 RepID=A0A6I6DHR6_9FIRM|nr:nickel pincer cofactor biosynthesis protein LarC [Candidatus Syntrophocurvum alkaliphilum]QGU00623.1 hypothetical protein SYNTR_2029 [Candidatus Syntrophocurvum alkaliphilum]
MNNLYFDCFSGISGDMLIASLLDLGVEIDYIKDMISLLNLSVSVSCDKKIVKGISSTKFSVNSSNNAPLRHLPDIEEIIMTSKLEDDIKSRSLGVFYQLADAEATVHGIPREKVHFHEIGAVDTIVDIVTSFLCLKYLDIDTVISSPIPWNNGYITISHGTYPLPAPATALLLSGIPCIGTNVNMELVTPTGAALISSIAKSFGVFPTSIPKAIGYGAGSNERGDSVPNLLRAVLLEPTDNLSLQNETVAVLETEVDDLNPEIFTHLYDKLLMDEQVLDLFTTPIIMKKNRPGVLLTIISKPENINKLSKLLISETTSLGVRYRLQQRMCTIREEQSVTTPWGSIKIKKAYLPSGGTRIKPEFEDCRMIAQDHNLPLIEVYSKIYSWLVQNSYL